MARVRTSTSAGSIHLPDLLKSKIYKTGQTRGADDDVIYQNRVGRNSTVLIPYQFFNRVQPEGGFENGFIVLLSPTFYFSTPNITDVLRQAGLVLGHNCLVFYETRFDWEAHNPETIGWHIATNRLGPLGGEYVARIPATTAAVGGDKINRGFTTTANKGAGIRQYEYASTTVIAKCRFQLEALYWGCHDGLEIAILNGMSEEQARARKQYALHASDELGLLDYDQLCHARLMNDDRITVCPLCLEPLSGSGFFTRLAQAEGREVPDLTVTEINLFHITELRYGVYNHRPYNLGWGHHHCNVVTKDSGITNTLTWMKGVLDRNSQAGFEF